MNRMDKRGRGKMSEEKSKLDYIVCLAELIAKDLIVETDDDYLFLTDKGREVAGQKWNEISDQDRLLLSMFIVERAEQEEAEDEPS